MSSQTHLRASADATPVSRTASLRGEARSHFAANVASNIAYVGLTTLAMTLYIPFLIRHLGIAAYGIIPLAHTAILYMSTITDGLNVAVNRYLTIDLNRNDEHGANSTFNTAMAISLLVVALLLPIGIGLAWFFPVLFQVAPGLEQHARWLFACITLTFFLTVIDSNFAVSTLVFHRFDLRNLVRGLTMATRMGSVVLCFALLSPQIWQVGAGFVLSALVSLVGNWWLWRALTPGLRLDWSAVDRSRSRALLGLSGWAMVNRIGMLLFLGTDLIIVNWFFGPTVTGQYGTLLLFPELIRSLVDTVSSVLSPAIMSRYALHDFDGLRQLASRSLKMLSVGLALPVGLLCGLASPFLQVWLGLEFQHLALLLIVLMGHLSITLATMPLTYVLTSYNKVRIQGVVTLLLGVLNISLSILFAWWGGFGVFGVAVSTVIVYIIKNLFFLSGYSASVMKLRWYTFYPALLNGAIATCVVALCSYGLTQAYWPASWLALAAIGLVVTITYTFVAYFLSLDRRDRQLLFELAPKPIRRYLTRGL
jgi:membrane protein EpsK